MALFQFVDSIGADPVVRLDLNAGPLWVDDKGLDLSPPPLRRARVSTLLSHGERIPAWAWDNRVLKLPVQLVGTTVDAAAGTLQALARELVRETNILRVQLGTVPYFFRTFAAPDYAFEMLKLFVQTGRAVLEIPAEPFAYGLAETLPAVLIPNDPGGGFPANANPYLETDISSWSILTGGGTLARSTAQAHQGIASLLFTPDGVGAAPEVVTEIVPISPGETGVGTAWLRCAATRTVRMRIKWRDATDSLITQTTFDIAVIANTWTPAAVGGVAPAGTAGAQFDVLMDGTPPASHLLWIDEARFYVAGNAEGGGWWNVDGVKGDVETPPVVKLASGSFTSDRQVLLAVRRQPATTDLPVVAEAETATMGLDTSAQPADSAMPSGFARVGFATTPAMTPRVTGAFGTTPSTVLRGRYRVFARYRKSQADDVVRVQLRWADEVTNAAVTLPSSSLVRYADLGIITVPAFGDPVVDGAGVPLPVEPVAVAVAAARDSGTGNLDVDRLVFVPAAGPVTSPGDDRLALVTVPALDVGDQAVVDAVSETTYVAGPSGLDNRRPMPVAGLYPLLNPGSNRLYLMANAGLVGPADSVADTVTVEVTYWPRYLLMRPVAS